MDFWASARKFDITTLDPDFALYVALAAEQRLRTLLEKTVTAVNHSVGRLERQFIQEENQKLASGQTGFELKKKPHGMDVRKKLAEIEKKEMEEEKRLRERAAEFERREEGGEEGGGEKGSGREVVAVKPPSPPPSVVFPIIQPVKEQVHEEEKSDVEMGKEEREMGPRDFLCPSPLPPPPSPQPTLSSVSDPSNVATQVSTDGSASGASNTSDEGLLSGNAACGEGMAASSGVVG
ncbi:hypothetical protein HDV00_009933 [Rhizophlyctis rosea]|nr:hypothetical protein HDV00_009933 [Rhizophlyctis rosea]